MDDVGRGAGGDFECSVGMGVARPDPLVRVQRVGSCLAQHVAPHHHVARRHGAAGHGNHVAFTDVVRKDDVFDRRPGGRGPIEKVDVAIEHISRERDALVGAGERFFSRLKPDRAFALGRLVAEDIPGDDNIRDRSS